MGKQVKIVFLDADTVGEVANLSVLEKLGIYTQYHYTHPSERIERIVGSDVVITNKVVIDRAVMDACLSLKLICVAATGMNNIDLDYAVKKGIQVKNVAGYSTESVVQATFSMLFYLLNHSTYYDKYVKSGDYSRSHIFTHHGRETRELNGKTFGIIGMGTIGKRVAKVAVAFGANVVYYSTTGKNLSTDFEHMELHDLLKNSDVVSIHCPLNDSTRNLLNAKRLAIMKPTAFLLNMGRGGIVDEFALATALDKGNIAGAALDVLNHEPIEPDNPLLTIKNKDKIFITPHIAWASREARELLIAKIAENIQSFLAEA
jgi:glycerate dehydrogenase